MYCNYTAVLLSQTTTIYILTQNYSAKPNYYPSYPNNYYFHCYQSWVVCLKTCSVYYAVIEATGTCKTKVYVEIHLDTSFLWVKSILDRYKCHLWMEKTIVYNCQLWLEHVCFFQAQLYAETRPPVIWTGKNEYGQVEIWVDG